MTSAPPAAHIREDVFGTVLVRIFGIGAFAALRVELGVFRLERVGNVFEENRTEHDMLVLGRIHVVAQRVGRLPQLRLEAQRRAIILAVALRSPARHHRPPVNLGAEYTIANLRLLYSAATAGRSPRCCRQRSTHSLVSFSCTPFCDRRRRRVRKSTRSISWSWLKQEKTTVSVPVTGSWWRCRHCAQISFIMHCIGELIDAIARWSERK